MSNVTFLLELPLPASLPNTLCRIEIQFIRVTCFTNLRYLIHVHVTSELFCLLKKYFHKLKICSRHVCCIFWWPWKIVQYVNFLKSKLHLKWISHFEKKPCYKLTHKEYFSFLFKDKTVTRTTSTSFIFCYQCTSWPTFDAFPGSVFGAATLANDLLMKAGGVWTPCSNWANFLPSVPFNSCSWIPFSFPVYFLLGTQISTSSSKAFFFTSLLWLPSWSWMCLSSSVSNPTCLWIGVVLFELTLALSPTSNSGVSKSFTPLSVDCKVLAFLAVEETDDTAAFFLFEFFAGVGVFLFFILPTCIGVSTPAVADGKSACLDFFEGSADGIVSFLRFPSNLSFSFVSPFSFFVFPFTTVWVFAFSSVACFPVSGAEFSFLIFFGTGSSWFSK